VITVGVYGILILATSFRYIPYFAQCEATNKGAIAYIMRTFSLLGLTLLVIAINAYLYYKILQVNKTQRENLQLHGNTRTTSKLAVLKNRLKEQIKPTVSVLLLGGLDGAFNLLFPLMYVLSRIILGSDSITRVYLVEFVITPLQWCQLICHPLVYGLYMTDIRKKICDFNLYHQIFNHYSRVVTLNSQRQNI